MVAGLKDVGGFGAGNDGTNRHARAQPFGQRHHVRQNAGPLVGKPFSGTAHAALHLVNHQQPVVLIAELAGLPKVVVGYGVNAAFTLNGFKKDRDHIRVVGRGCFQCIDIVQGHADKALNQRAKTGLYFRVSRGA